MLQPSQEDAMTVFEIQQALAVRGFDPGAIDGVWGRRTSSAVRAFQTRHRLQADGIVGPQTRKALFGNVPADSNPLDDVALVWFQEAWRLLGVTERPGAGSNPDILQWATDLGIPYHDDDVAWCGLFVAHCIGSTLTQEPLPTNPLGARAWERFGAPCGNQAGAITVFWRESKTCWKGHVGLYAGEDDVAIHVLGGNQSNKVSVARVAKSRLLGCRWPATAPMGTGGPVRVKADGSLSRNEA
jgi:uncharacterized protein (TIGR02594 family)